MCRGKLLFKLISGLHRITLLCVFFCCQISVISTINLLQRDTLCLKPTLWKAEAVFDIKLLSNQKIKIARDNWGILTLRKCAYFSFKGTQTFFSHLLSINDTRALLWFPWGFHLVLPVLSHRLLLDWEFIVHFLKVHQRCSVQDVWCTFWKCT